MFGDVGVPASCGRAMHLDQWVDEVSQAVLGDRAFGVERRFDAPVLPERRARYLDHEESHLRELARVIADRDDRDIGFRAVALGAPSPPSATLPEGSFRSRLREGARSVL